MSMPVQMTLTLHRSANFKVPPTAVDFLYSCEGVYHKQKVWFILCFLGQIITWQYNPNFLDLNCPMYCYK